MSCSVFNKSVAFLNKCTFLICFCADCFFCGGICRSTNPLIWGGNKLHLFSFKCIKTLDIATICWSICQTVLLSVCAVRFRANKRCNIIFEAKQQICAGVNPCYVTLFGKLRDYWIISCSVEFNICAATSMWQHFSTSISSFFSPPLHYNTLASILSQSWQI